MWGDVLAQLPSGVAVVPNDEEQHLRLVAGLKDYQGADLSALFEGMFAAEHVECVRDLSTGQRKVRRSQERPRFLSFTEMAEAESAEQVAWQRRRREREIEAAEEARRELERPLLRAEEGELREAISNNPIVIGLRSEVRELRARVIQLEGGNAEDR